MIKRDFEKYGVKFHLNDFHRNEFDTRYTLLYFNDGMLGRVLSRVH